MAITNDCVSGRLASRQSRRFFVSVSPPAFVATVFIAQSSNRECLDGLQDSGYACTIDGYNATTMNHSGPPSTRERHERRHRHSPTQLHDVRGVDARPQRSARPRSLVGLRESVGPDLVGRDEPDAGRRAIAWYDGPGMGHVAYVARVNWSNHTVFLVSDNYAVASAGYTSNTWAPFTQATGYIHLRDLTAPLPMAARKIRRDFILRLMSARR